ncbi:MAG: hypothetical protein ACKO2L_18955 [Planctomycetaceae bacterium]
MVSGKSEFAERVKKSNRVISSTFYRGVLQTGKFVEVRGGLSFPTFRLGWFLIRLSV